MKLIKPLLSILAISIMLTACKPSPPQIFGVNQNVWNSLTPDQKQQVIKGYNQRQKINAQNAPLESAIGATSAAVQNKQNMDYQQQQMNRMPQIHMPSMPTPPHGF